MKIILFGAGGFLRDNENNIKKLPNTEIVGIVDNNMSVIGTKCLGHIVTDLENVKIKFDYVVITSIYAVEIEKQLINSGYDKHIIKRFREYEAFANKENQVKYVKSEVFCDKKSILAITPIIEYNGACMALLYVLEQLKKVYNYRVSLISPKYKDGIMEYVTNKEIEVIVYPNVEFDSNNAWLDNFDYYIVNTLLMRNCLEFINPKRTIWWLHESESSYVIEQRLWGNLDNKLEKCVHTFCVSKTEKKVFQKYVSSVEAEVLEYGLPDAFDSCLYNNKTQDKKTVFAVIGFIAKIKGQDILLKAIHKLPPNYLSNCEFWIIGDNDDKAFYDDIKSNIYYENIKLLGGKSHSELEVLYKKIDVVVSTSRQDSLPIVVTEGFMHRKLCIISDVIGTTEYVEDGVHALFFKSEDDSELAEKICYALDHKDEMKKVAENGRKIYEKYFSIEQVGKKFNSIFMEMNI